MKNLKKISIYLVLLLIFSCNNFPSGPTPGNQGEDPVLDYKISGLSEIVNLSSVSPLRGFRSDIIDGYNSLEELANDLDSIALEAGLRYIEEYDNYNYDWGILEDGIVEMAASEPENSGSEGYTTNTQVENVDEPDSVKSDGTYIYLTTGTDIQIFNLSGDLISSTTPFGNKYISGILLNNDKIIAYSYDKTDNIKILNVNNGVVTSTQDSSIPGYITSMRLINDTVLVYLTQWIDLWELYDGLFYQEDDTSVDSPGIPVEITNAEVRSWIYIPATEEDREKARERLTINIPSWRNKVILDLFSDGTTIDMDLVQNTLKIYNPVEGDFENDKDDDGFIPYNPSFSSFQKVVSFDIGVGISSSSSAGAFTTGWGNTVYSNGSISVLANQGWSYLGNYKWETNTYFTSFETDSFGTTPGSVGKFTGYVNDQFSMDYYNGYLRVGLTIGDWWATDTTNYLAVIDITGSEMEEVGRISDLGHTGERIMSMRFAGDKAYMVTFLQTDPFYTLDLSDPFNPIAVGELEVPGYSGYIHPINDDYILTVGEDAGDFKVSIYDVSNFSNPVEACDSFLLDSAWSESLWDHHAFRFFNNRLIIPLSTYSSYDYVSGFTLFDISEDYSSITKKGEINHMNQSNNYYDYYYWYTNPRSMVFTDDVDHIVTIRNGSIKSSNWDTLEQEWITSLEE